MSTPEPRRGVARQGGRAADVRAAGGGGDRAGRVRVVDPAVRDHVRARVADVVGRERAQVVEAVGLGRRVEARGEAVARRRVGGDRRPGAGAGGGALERDADDAGVGVGRRRGRGRPCRAGSRRDRSSVVAGPLAVLDDQVRAVARDDAGGVGSGDGAPGARRGRRAVERVVEVVAGLRAAEVRAAVRVQRAERVRRDAGVRVGRGRGDAERSARRRADVERARGVVRVRGEIGEGEGRRARRGGVDLDDRALDAGLVADVVGAGERVAVAAGGEGVGVVAGGDRDRVAAGEAAARVGRERRALARQGVTGDAGAAVSEVDLSERDGAVAVVGAAAVRGDRPTGRTRRVVGDGEGAVGGSAAGAVGRRDVARARCCCRVGVRVGARRAAAGL